MFKFLIKSLKKVIVSALFIYAYNVMAVPINIIIPINLVTVFLVSILGIPAMIGLILFSLF